ncbi:MAG: hypothetical protein D8M58_21415 [Calditrichaeota bacterium]|nr:MAG: hypothetical protein DWQ03_00140 [Calditrichota bacterium]MBL1207973.1 hypothetical protein [Calditrichota bacterium]NOG47809.1 hypothetical protein [Calditrichota bacterium]
MAEGKIFICNECNKTIETLSDGNPYYLDYNGSKQYAHHPDHENLEKCIGNGSPAICLSCAAEFMIDSAAPITSCPQCQSKDIADTFELEDKTCPFCRIGIFQTDPDKRLIS